MIRRILFTLTFLALSSSVASAQFLIFWDKDDGDWNVSSNWFEEFGPPDSDLADIGVISNGGLAYLESNATNTAGGLVLGERGGENGTLHIRDGGALTLVEDLDVQGLARVGQAGTGTLIVDRGGSFTAESLRTGGHQSSSLVLGGGGSGTADVSVNGPAILTRNTHVIGSNVSFEAESLNLSGAFTAEILGAQHSILDISDAANLGGTLNLQFANGVQPTVGQTWDLIDAGTITGGFSSITSNVSPGPGLAFTVNTVEGGQNGMVAQVGVDARLQLTIDRRTGASQIQNLAEGQALTIDGYGVGSRSGTLNNDNWLEFEDNAWAGNGSNTHVAQITLSSVREIGAGTSVDLGNVYAYQPSTLGDRNEDVFFEYHVAGGNVVNGLVDFTGAHNDVVLVVDDDEVFIQNQSTESITINGYAIVSKSGNLDPSSWTSLAAGDNNWTEANPAENHLTELNLSNTLTLPATSGPISLGNIVAAGANDLEFFVNMADTGPHEGTVEYQDGVIAFGAGLLGDCNSDGTLTAADLTCVDTITTRDAVLGALNTLPGDLDGDGAVAFADFLVLSTNFGQTDVGYHEGDVDLAGGVGFSDFLIVSTNFGQGLGAQAAAVPEPSSGVAVVWLALLAGVCRKRGSARRLS